MLLQNKITLFLCCMSWIVWKFGAGIMRWDSHFAIELLQIDCIMRLYGSNSVPIWVWLNFEKSTFSNPQMKFNVFRKKFLHSNYMLICNQIRTFSCWLGGQILHFLKSVRALNERFCTVWGIQNVCSVWEMRRYAFSTIPFSLPILNTQIHTQIYVFFYFHDLHSVMSFKSWNKLANNL